MIVMARPNVDHLCDNSNGPAAFATGPLHPLRFSGHEGGALLIMQPHQELSDQTPARVPTSVYRYYDSHGVLLYVGVTGRGVTRNVEHNKSKPWWEYVARQEVDHLPSRPAALAREASLIRDYCPPFNTQGNPHHAELQLAALRVASEPERDRPTSIPLHFLMVDDSYRTVLRTMLLPYEWNPTGLTKVKLRIDYGFSKCRVERIDRVGPFITVALNTAVVPPTHGRLKIKWESPTSTTFRVESVVIGWHDQKPSKATHQYGRAR